MVVSSFQERLECHDRMDRRSIRDRLHLERHQEVRDAVLRGDLSAWLERRIREVEDNVSKGEEGEQAFMRTLLRSSKRRKRAFMSEVRSGTLRRAASEDYLPGEILEIFSLAKD